MQPPAAPAVCNFAFAIQTRRIEHQEKIKKRRNDQFFRECLRLQQNHQRSELKLVALRPTNQPPQSIRCVDNVRIGEPEELRRIGLRGIHTRLKRPELTCPAGRERRRQLYFDALRGAGFRHSLSGHIAGAILTVVINNDYGKLPGIILSARAATVCAIVAASLRAGTTATTRGQNFRSGNALAVCFRNPDLPEMSVEKEKVEPNQKR